MTGLLTGC